MLTPPDAIISALQPFSSMFRQRTWAKAQLLLVGAILAPRRRTITSALRVMGLSDEAGFAKYHRVLNRALWSSLQMSRVLLVLLIEHLTQDDEPLVFGIDETLERRRGQSHQRQGSVPRRRCAQASRTWSGRADCAGSTLMWLAHIPWANRTWALPILTALAPAESYHQKVGRRHKKDHRLGTPDDYPTAPLAARSTHSRRD